MKIDNEFGFVNFRAYFQNLNDLPSNRVKVREEEDREWRNRVINIYCENEEYNDKFNSGDEK